VPDETTPPPPGHNDLSLLLAPVLKRLYPHLPDPVVGREARFIAAALGEHVAPRVEIAALEAENTALRATIARSKFVAEHWRKGLMRYPSTQGQAHPLCMVLAALDGETEPGECGLDDDAHDAFRALSPAVIEGAE
jgi:hypothetical protein